MRRFGGLCGVLALAAVSLCPLGLSGSVGRAALPPSVYTIRPRPIAPVVLPVPPPTPSPPSAPVAAGQVLFLSTRDGAAEIYWMDDSGAGQTRLTSVFGGVADPTLSPSGRLTYSAPVAGHWEIVAGAVNGDVDQLTHDGARDREPRWIGTSTLVYVSDRSGNQDIWTLDTQSGAAVDLTKGSPGPDVDPAPSPDGTTIAFASAAKGSSAGFDIYLLNLSSMAVTQLTHDHADNRHPSWSYDGKQLVFDRAGSGGSDIWTMAADGSGAQRVIASTADEFGASFAPGPVGDKPRFVYVTDVNGNYEIWAANVDGTGAFDLSQSPGGADFAPFWAPFPQGLHVEELRLTPNEVSGAGGGPNSPVHCTVQYTGKEPIVGTPYRDVICGSPRPDRIYGRGGNDVIYPRGGNDTVYGGAGDDLIYARGGGNDTIDGGGGSDVAYVDDPGDQVSNVEAIFGLP